MQPVSDKNPSSKFLAVAFCLSVFISCLSMSMQATGKTRLSSQLFGFLFLIALLAQITLNPALAQEKTEPTTASNVTDANLPWGAERLLPASVPAEFNQAFDNLLKQGDGREVLAWAGNYKKQANAAKLTQQLQTNFRAAGWQYEAAGRNGEVDIFSLLKEGTPRRVVLGYFVPGDDVLVCALMEVVRVEAPAPAKTEPRVPTQAAGEMSIYGKWFRTTGGSVIDPTGKTTLKSGVDFTFEFFLDGSVEYTRKKDVLNIMQCKINATDKSRGKFSISGNTLTLNLGAMKSVQTNSCNTRENYNKTLEPSSLTVRFQIKKMNDITRPDNPRIMCFDGNEVCYEFQR